VGVIGLAPRSPGKFADPEVQRLLLLCAAQLASAVERELLSAAAHGAELAAETERARGSLLAAVSHDLKTPLASILFAATTLERAPAELPHDRRSELIGTVIEETERLARLVANVLSMTKLESGGLAVRRQTEDVSELVDGALRVLGPRLEGRSVSVELERSLPFVDVDALLIQQVLVNLLENAVRYTPARSALKITATSGEHGVAICVQDEGPGIAVEEREKIFEKFFRGSQSSRSDGGVGLGLAICRAAVQAHGGRIYVKHGGNKGARVEFTLPIKRIDSFGDGDA
jgi:two-component system sensor histidine kinase KdpD